uniref:Uncharacterized protein n=1 Tax=Aegilops tauschii subsp. strangulata TaxID=200361 RepID=A0A453FY67_AEGTS
ALLQLNKSYIEICRSTQVPAVGMLEFSNMCMILSDQVCKHPWFFIMYHQYYKKKKPKY